MLFIISIWQFKPYLGVGDERMGTSSAWETPANFAGVHTHATSRSCVRH